MTETTQHVLESTDIDTTLALGRCIGRTAQPGDVLALVGPLGAGKTHLVKGVAQGLGIDDPRQVISPTFVLIREYQGRLWLYHFDAYRLSGVGEMYELGCEEYFEGEGVCVVEWADRVRACLPRRCFEINLSVVGPTHRHIELAATGERPVEWRRAVLADMPAADT